MRIILSLIAVAAGGALGALARFGIAEVLRVVTSWPAYIGTLLANMIGCFGIGVVFVLLETGDRPEWVRPLVITGLLGAFTTFSTFSLDAMHLIDDRKLGTLMIYLTSSVLVGLASVRLGMWLAARS